MKDLEAGGESNVFASFILNHKYFSNDIPLFTRASVDALDQG